MKVYLLKRAPTIGRVQTQDLWRGCGENIVVQRTKRIVVITQFDCKLLKWDDSLRKRFLK